MSNELMQVVRVWKMNGSNPVEVPIENQKQSSQKFLQKRISQWMVTNSESMDHQPISPPW